MTLSSHALSTVAVVLAELSLDDGASPIIERMINAASDFIEKIAGGRCFEYQAAISEYRKGTGNTRLLVERTPIVTLTSIAIYDQDGALDETLETDTYNIERASSGIIYREDGFELSDRKKYRVVYNGGWVTPAQAIASPEGPDKLVRTLPYDLEEALILTVTSMWSRRGQDRDIATGNVENGPVITYRDPGDIVPVEARRIVENYRRASIA